MNTMTITFDGQLYTAIYNPQSGYYLRINKKGGIL